MRIGVRIIQRLAMKIWQLELRCKVLRFRVSGQLKDLVYGRV